MNFCFHRWHFVKIWDELFGPRKVRFVCDKCGKEKELITNDRGFENE